MRHKCPAALILLTTALATLLGACSHLRSSHAASDDSLMDAWQTISNKTFVDLTHTFSPTTPVWEGFGPATFSTAVQPGTGRPYTIRHDGFHTLHYSLVGQYGTHIDPPAHFDPHGMTLDELPVKNMRLS